MYDENMKNTNRKAFIICFTIIFVICAYLFSRIYLDPDNYIKGRDLLLQKDYYGAIQNFNKAEKNNGDNFDLYFKRGEAFFEIQKYTEALKDFNKATKIDATKGEAKAWVAYSYIMLEDYTKAEVAANEAIKLSPNSSFAYNIEGQVFYSKYQDEDALVAFEKSISIDKNYYEPYINKIKTLYDEKKYETCIDFSKSILTLFPNKTSLYLYIANSLSHIEKHKDAMAELNLGLKINSNASDLLSSLGWEYLYNKDYNKATDYCKKALALSPDLKDAIDLQASIEKENQTEAAKIVDFVRSNYLYIDKIADFEAKATEFQALKTVTAEDIKNFITSIKLKNDYFTFTLTGAEFDKKEKDEATKQVSFKNLDSNTIYLKINAFTETTDSDFKPFIEKIPNPESKNLVIDLRNNGGGVIAAANNILDLLLPTCTPSFTIDRSGAMHSYHSDDKQIKFKKIILLVNDRTASSSELLTLGLRDYLNNVVVIGQETFGKGVGQKTYDDVDKKYSIFLVSFYWNVKEKNIQGDGVFPDITTGTSESDYFNEVNKLVK